ncbi:MAG TPA: hypothetical protein VKF36_19995 [Syntrophorhabdales bacterium]|nr:hypothetical protein [Syntrophorhabdales bacterium]
MRLSSQRGVSLMLLILVITVFAGVAIGIVTLLRSRYESYPYQVQSYQAYALANAGVEFAIRYAKDNPSGFFQTPYSYIPQYPSYKDFTFGNGKFSLSYQAGCPDMLYSKGTAGNGTATREVQLSNFSLYTGEQSNTLYMTGLTATRTCIGYDCGPSHTCYNGTSSVPCSSDPYPPGPPPGGTYPASYNGYNGDRIRITYCNPYAGNNSNYTLYFVASTGTPTATLAATQPVTLSRVGFSDDSPPSVPSGALNVWWVFDATCGISVPLTASGVNVIPYCPQAFPWWGGCPTTPTYDHVYGGRGLVDCVVSGTSGHFNFPPLGAVWDGTSNPPPAAVGYPFFWNTDSTNDNSTYYDASCRPVVPCDLNDPACQSASDCTAGGIGQCYEQTSFSYNGTYIMYGGSYSCFDSQTGCTFGRAWNAERSRGVCHYPMGGGPHGPPLIIQDSSFSQAVGLNNLTIDTLGHLDSQINANGPIKMYLSFYTYLKNKSTNQNQTPVQNVFIFTVR